jgi:MFS family permease
MSASSRQSCLLNSYRRNLGLIGGSRCRWCVTISTTYNISDSAQIMWSLVASFQAFLSGKSSFYACRALLGVIEGGFIPDNILYLSYWYTGKELPRRLSFFWTAYQFTSIVGAFLALGLLKLRGANGLAGWRWLFAIEGTITGLIGVATYFYLPPSPRKRRHSSVAGMVGSTSVKKKSWSIAYCVTTLRKVQHPGHGLTFLIRN